MAGKHEPDLLRGLLRCALCTADMVGVHTESGELVYTCTTDCRQPYVDAKEAESDLLLAALIKGATQLYPEYARQQRVEKLDGAAPLVDADTVAYWQRCDVSDRRSVLKTAFARVEVTGAGEFRPVWRRSKAAFR